MRRLGSAAVAVALLAVMASWAGAVPIQDRPTLSPVEATFNGTIAQSTTYRVELHPPSPAAEWRWELEAPAGDPNCTKLRVTSVEEGSSAAEWFHGDGDGCRHLGTEHAGRVTVVVEVGAYQCTASITGTSTRTGPEPPPCFRRPSPPPPPPASPSAPTIRDPEKEKWRDYSGALFAAGAASYALAIGCALVPSPDPVSKGLALIGALVGLGQYAAGGWALLKAEDPPDENYKRLVKVVTPKLQQVRTGNGITAAEVAAVNALNGNLARIAGYDAAFITSFERAQGAYAARDGTWDRRQSRAAAGYARAEAKLLDARPALESALRRAIARAGVPALTSADARRATQHIEKRGLSAGFVADAERLGLGGAPLAAFGKAAANVEPTAIGGPVAARISPRAALRAYRESAALLRKIAARLDKR